MIRALLGLLLLAGLLPAAALAADPPQDPLLRIEAGGHIGAVPRMALDRSGRLLLTGSYDKTVRLWVMGEWGRPDHGLLATLRPPIGPNEEGEIYAVAITPDARRIFAAGATGAQWNGTFSLYVFDTQRAQLIGQLPGLRAPVNDLAVSRDGTRLAAGLAGGGILVWDAQRLTPLFEDKAYAGPVRALAFDARNRLFTTSADGHVRGYDAQGRHLADVVPAPGLRPWGIAASPDSELVAVAYENTLADGKLRVDVLRAATLAAVLSPDTAGLSGEGLLSVAWTADGQGGVQLLAGGYARAGGYNLIRRWADFGLGAPTDIAASRDTILHILPVPGGGGVYSAEDPGWGQIGPDGKILHMPAPPLLDLRPARDRLAVSNDGLVVEFNSQGGTQGGIQGGTLRFDAAARRLLTVPRADTRLATARTAAPGLASAGWQNGPAPRLNEAALALDRSELARSLAILPGDQAVLLGTDTHLRLYARDGRRIAEASIPAAAWAVGVSGDGRVAVAALLDGTLRWYGLDPDAPLQERAALFAQPDRDRWLLFTPEGLFDHADAGGQTLVGVHLNRARNQQPEWVNFAQAYRPLHAPAAVLARLRGDAKPARARMTELGDLRDRLARQPAVTLASVCVPQPDKTCTDLPLRNEEGARLPTQAASVRLSLLLQDRGLGVGNVDVFVNDRNVGRYPATPPQPGKPGTTTVDIPLDPGDNQVQARAYDSTGTVYNETAPLKLTAPTEAPAPGDNGRLFIVAMGVDRFAQPQLALHYAVADATSFVDVTRRAGAPLFRSVEATLLINEQATREGILSALDRVARQAGPADTFLFYTATHGVRGEGAGRFLLIPHDVADTSSVAALSRSALDETALIAALSRIRARNTLLLLDTCYSGQVTAEELANVGHETGRYMLAASTSVQEALDSYDNRNGVFLYAVREALTGRAAHGSDNLVSALSLGEYVSHRVGELARQKGHDQDAVFRTAQRDLRSFPVGRIAQ